MSCLVYKLINTWTRYVELLGMQVCIAFCCCWGGDIQLLFSLVRVPTVNRIVLSLVPTHLIRQIVSVDNFRVSTFKMKNAKNFMRSLKFYIYILIILHMSYVLYLASWIKPNILVRAHLSNRQHYSFSLQCALDRLLKNLQLTITMLLQGAPQLLSMQNILGIHSLVLTLITEIIWNSLITYNFWCECEDYLSLWPGLILF